MPLEMVLNELSLQPAPSINHARQRMAQFIDLLRQATLMQVS
ncbi:hypothetical protein [Candidatus Viridilinea mediisalina]|nr:hypothetical protein [Candidatus Viridilinea mediisalina]